MAYDLHITKKNDWFEENPPILLTEWQSLLDKNTDLIPVEKIEGITSDGTKFEYGLKNSKIAKWLGKNTFWFVFENGNITISNPDEEAIQKAKDIASFLHAKVQGDDGEIY